MRLRQERDLRRPNTGKGVTEPVDGIENRVMEPNRVNERPNGKMEPIDETE